MCCPLGHTSFVCFAFIIEGVSLIVRFISFVSALHIHMRLIASCHVNRHSRLLMCCRLLGSIHLPSLFVCNFVVRLPISIVKDRGYDLTSFNLLRYRISAICMACFLCFSFRVVSSASASHRSIRFAICFVRRSIRFSVSFICAFEGGCLINCSFTIACASFPLPALCVLVPLSALCVCRIIIGALRISFRFVYLHFRSVSFMCIIVVIRYRRLPNFLSPLPDLEWLL